MAEKPKFNVIKMLRARGLLEDMSESEPNLEELVENHCLGVYAGIDPSADSMHLGHLNMIVAMRWWQMAGHRCYLLVGGATGRIGDPGGRSVERPLHPVEEVQRCAAALGAQIKAIMPANGAAEYPVQMRNNLDWFGAMSALDFLREVGRYFRLGPMLAKEMVRTRLQSAEGLSYTEFSYQLLQGYDFMHLFEKDKVTVQLGGSDQWGNIVSGIDLVRKRMAGTVYGVTWPLLLRSDGKKFGKSESGAVWLSREHMSPYDFFQYLLRVPDADVVTLLRRLTFLSLEKIAELEHKYREGHAEPNEGQRLLATEVTLFVHGELGLAEALEATQRAAPGGAVELSGASLAELARQFGSLQIPAEQLGSSKIVDLMVMAQLCKSKGEARRLIVNGGVSLNNRRVEGEGASLALQDFIEGRFAVLAVGKRKRIVIEKIMDS